MGEECWGRDCTENSFNLILSSMDVFFFFSLFFFQVELGFQQLSVFSKKYAKIFCILALHAEYVIQGTFD